MVSKRFYRQLIFRIIVILIFALGFAYGILKNDYWLALLCMIGLFWISLNLLQFLNSTNRKIAFLFKSIKNEDFTLKFPEDSSLKSLREVHRSLNRMNEMVQKIHIKNQTQERYYQEILKQATIGILTINQKGHILFANPTAKRLLNSEVLNHTRQLEKVDKVLYEQFSNLRPFDRKLFQLTNERETRQLAVISNQIILNNEILNLVTLQDIHTELDEKETDSWIKLIRVLTHEIMNTVTPITSISESILSYYKDTDSVDEQTIKNTAKGLEVIKNQGNDLMSFVQSYRSFLSIPKPDKKIIKVNSLLEKVLLLMSEDKEGLDIPMQIISNTEDLEIFADEKQITQILINLCRNAIHSLESIESPEISIYCGITKNQDKFITVKDNGPGIQEELLDQIFVPFFTTKSTGTGIGLSLSKQIMQLHGGNIKVHSVPYQNTSFTLVF